MTKIEEFEQNLIRHGMSNAGFEEYKKLLCRVRGNFSKCQHCYTTAIQFSPKFSKEAISLIKYGVENFNDGWFTEYTSYLYIGHIYEKISDFENALAAFLRAESVLGESQASYRNHIALNILWAKLHVDNFEYSYMIEQCYNRFLTQSEFESEFINNRFKMVIAKIVISLHHNSLNLVKEAYEEAIKMCDPRFIGKLASILNKHNYTEKLQITDAARKYLIEVKKLFDT